MLAEFAAPTLLRPALPLPTRERWEPLRAGIIGVWQYPEQEFVFHRGRLVLMGRNGAGKTKVLEVLFPFLLDARNDARRLSPGGGDGRTWRWNLLEIGKDGQPHRKRGDGIVWIEFGRRGHAGAVDFATIGARLSAVFGSTRVPIAWFLTDQRPDEDISLTVALGDSPDKRIPIGRDALEQALEGHGQVFGDRASYRRAIDERLLGLRGRFDGLMNLLISLRQPKLSEKLDLERLVGHLREALPPVNDDRIRQLAEALESLQEDDVSLERLRRARTAVERFLVDYGTYATLEARAGADRVRAAEESVRQASARLHSAEEAERQASADVTRFEASITEAQERLSGLGGRIAAHLETPAMKAADQLRQAEEDADRAARDAAQRDDDATNLESELTHATESLDEARHEAEAAGEAFDEARATAAAAAAAAATIVIHDRLVAVIDEASPGARAEVERACADRRRALDALGAAASQLATLRTRLRDARQDRGDAEGKLHAAEDARAAAEQGLSRARVELADALVLWAAGLVELRVDDVGIEPVLDAIGEGRLAQDAAAELAVPARAAIAAALGELDARQRTLDYRRTELHGQREKILATQVPRPERAATRPADRAGRPGAPFYEVVDFVAGISSGDAAGLEAALDGAGILDAWVLPDGSLLDAELDAALRAAGQLPGPTLREVLTAAGEVVPAGVVERILASIGWGERADGAWVAGDGRFSLGPLTGRFAKDEPGFIGAGAQAATRARLVAEIERGLAALELEQDVLTASRAALTARDERVSAEVAAVPSEAPLAATRRDLAARETDLARRADALTAATEKEVRLAADEARGSSQLAESFAGLGFPPGMTDVAAARDALSDYKAQALELVAASLAGRHVAERVDRESARAERVGGLARQARALHEARALEARRLAEKTAELRRRHGASAQAAMARLAELRRDEERAHDDLETGRAALGNAREARGRLQSTLDEARGRLREAEGRRADAAAAFGRLAATPLFSLATDQLPDADPRGWAIRRIVELARAAIDTSDRASFEQPARNAATRSVHTRFSELQADVGTDFALVMDQTTPDGLLLVDAQIGDDRIPVASLATHLERTIAEQASQLDARSREILEHYLFEGVGQELGDRIREARSLIDQMNAELAKCPTASGIRIHLRWELGASVPEGAEGATNLLLTEPVLLHGTDVERIVAFLQGRVTAALEQEASRGFADALVEALDYRSWFDFTIEEIQPNGHHHRLNSRDFPTGSGGEKSVTLHLPLFAAVAAYYTGEAAKAPRLFFLDEAFAGIDRPMRASMMGFIRNFDLDFVITTPDDWTTYAELDGTAIYQLYRDPAERGIYTQHWVWTGRQLLDDAALRALDEAAG